MLNCYKIEEETAQTTSNNTQTTIKSISVPTDACLQLQVLVTARSDDGDNAKSWVKFAAVNNFDGTAGIVGSLLDLVSVQGTLGALTWACTLDTTGADVRVRVTGQSGTDINWCCLVQGHVLETA